MMEDDQSKYLHIGEHARLRLGMYLGGVDKRALHNMIAMLLEFLLCDTYSHIWLEFLPDNHLRVRAKGASFPMDMEGELTLFERIFDTDIDINLVRDNRKYVLRNSVGMAGTRLTTINALCSYFEVLNFHQLEVWRLVYAGGKRQSELEMIEAKDSVFSSGIQITLKPDYSIFEPCFFDLEIVLQYGRQLCALFPGLNIHVADLSETSYGDNPDYVHLHYTDGLVGYFKEQYDEKGAVTSLVTASRKWSAGNRYPDQDIEVQFVAQYADHSKAVIHTLLPHLTIEVADHGLHIYAAASAIQATLYYHRGTTGYHNLPPHFTFTDITSGLHLMFGVQHPDPHAAIFENASRYRYGLMNAELYGIVSDMVFHAFSQLSREELDKVYQKVIANYELRVSGNR